MSNEKSCASTSINWERRIYGKLDISIENTHFFRDRLLHI